MGWLAVMRSGPPLAMQDIAARGETTMISDGPLTMFGPGLRLTVGNAWYAGFEVSGGTSGLPVFAGFGAGHLVLGARTSISQSNVFALETAAGALITASAQTATDTRGSFEVRARADRWLNPWLSLGAFAGVDPFARDVSAGLLFGFHARAFDGGRP